jgi:SAM-dependent methyltransferase
MTAESFNPTLLNLNMGKYAQSDWHDYYYDFLHLIPPGSTILDVGSGRGGMARWLTEELACTVACVDASPEALAACRAKGLTTYEVDLNWSSNDIPGTYDVIVFSSSLESLLDPFGVVKHIKKNLEPNGRLVIWLLNFSFILSRLAYLRGASAKCVGYSAEARKLGLRGYDDIQFFTKSTLGLMLREAGYTDLQWYFGEPKPKKVWKKFLFNVAKTPFKKRFPDLFSPYLCVSARYR